MTSDLIVQIYSTEAENELQSALDDLSAAGIVPEIKKERPGTYACLDWLIPTALVLWASDKFFGAFLEEAGKENYQALKSFTSKVFEKTLGHGATVTRTIKIMSGATKPDVVFSGNLSVMYKSTEGWAAKLLFPLDVTLHDYEIACQRFANLVSSHVADPASSPLSIEVERVIRTKSIGLPPSLKKPDAMNSVRMLVYWNASAECFYVADPVASGKSQKLVSHRLGTDA